MAVTDESGHNGGGSCHFSRIALSVANALAGLSVTTQKVAHVKVTPRSERPIRVATDGHKSENVSR